MMPKETVLAGGEHPGTELQVLKSGAGYYLGFLDTDGSPYSRESSYFPSKAGAELLLTFLRHGNE